MSLRYYRTVSDGVTATHVEGLTDYALCGFDVVGDPEIHDAEPVELPPGKHRITCKACLQVIAIVREVLQDKPQRKRAR